ncbi:TPA: aspartate-semialdehyde dehydrogenase [Streptococcus equi subsp. zooepidemicus]|uniref:aspartate-semialdehyde dehydrogenase n=1 Tax=Streptococcus equi TaxID=1336 RepID=UPI00198033A7|nr:aspartate-semialdehyde dehydrogenase [Streptococcus equi]MCD3406592.1 aspartate-semialdehyde dehydrogenase [Streptococcus equi subsp. zooepidemicus]MDI5901357.1 aspartate-semialdehyde dehydrogenase [Streptococcus equi subsp. zooepidemicus]MDI5947780.1 aspartate-semialdehyde dehydrogenase [Streptococcus equi subsp. zooepidemicus]MDI5958977.1 aspartate-semialdehyde dehydrogenase [Streptococcus equi subsp. zooepidemicus]MDI5960936.1 aspartate-semialdehyde dehydrogenase [Streptococcus equi subs
MGYTVAVVGATGAVGQQMIKMLEESSLPISAIKLLASARSAGKILSFKGEDFVVEELTKAAFQGIDLALFSAGGNVSAKYAPYAVAAGAVVVDNTSYFRQHPAVPLVVPEVNAHALDTHQGLVACPNCSTIQMMIALEPIRQRWGLERIIVSTYQAVSGAGQSAIRETLAQYDQVINQGLSPKEVEASVLPSAGDKRHYPIAFNALPQIDRFTENDYTYEEMKMTNETKKIMEDDTIKVSATCVRIPVLSAHSESIYIETKAVATIEAVKEAIAQFPGAVLEDDTGVQRYPQAVNAVGSRETFVGRLRKDLDVEKGIHMWVVSDNLLKGAAWNSVQIAETLHERGLVQPAQDNLFDSSVSFD